MFDWISPSPTIEKYRKLRKMTDRQRLEYDAEQLRKDRIRLFGK